jgi:hypothetical protein
MFFFPIPNKILFFALCFWSQKQANVSMRGIEVGDITTFSQLSETTTTFAASNKVLTNVRKDSAPKYKGKTRIRFACKAAGKQRSRKHDEATEKRRRNRDSLRTNCPWHITGYADVTPPLPESPITVTAMKLQHNCKPSSERLLKSFKEVLLQAKFQWIHLLACMCRFRMFIIDNKLDLRTDAKSIANLKLLVGRSFKDDKIHQCTVWSLQRPIESLCKQDEITFLFADLLNREIPESNRIRNVSKVSIIGFAWGITTSIVHLANR